MIQDVADLELTLHRRRDGGYVAELRFAQAGGDTDVRVSPDDAAPLPLDLVELLAQGADLDVYGALLGTMLLGPGPVASAVARARAVTQSQDRPLRIRLLIGPGAEDLHAVHWEALRDPETGSALCSGSDILFSRYLTSLDWQPIRPRPRGELRALVVIANPRDLAERFEMTPVDVAGELQRAQDGLRGVAEVTALASGGSASFERIEEALRSPCDILYLVAHGALDRKGVPKLWLERPDCETDVVSGIDLTEMIRGLRERPRLVVLISCQSAGNGLGPALPALGPRLAAAGVPAVIGMQGNLSMASATRLLPAFFQELKAVGRVDAALAAARRAIARRDDWWMPALFMRSRSGRLWSDASDVPPGLGAEEVERGLVALADAVSRHGPGLAPMFERHAAVLRSLAAAPEFDGESVAARLAVEELDRLCEAIFGDDVEFADVTRGRAPPLSPQTSPFPGLCAFQGADRPFFFGREALVERLLERLRGSPFLAILGASGSGKSSLVLAGVVPALQQAEPGLTVVVVRPGPAPLARWDAEVVPGISAAAAVVVVDQFEEVWTLCADGAARLALFSRILDLTARHRVILTMRADFWGEVAPHEALREAMQRGQELVAPLDAAALRRVMERQAEAAGLRLEPGLGQIVLEDVASEPGAMPLLQHTLLELWRRRHGRYLRTSEYQAIGGVQGAIARTASQLLDELDPADQTLARHIFLRLTRVDTDASLGEAPRDTRTRVPVEELRPADVEPVRVHALLERLVEARLIVKSVEAEGRVVVEVAHEALIRHWDRLRAWLDQERSDLVFFAVLRDAAAAWDEGERSANLVVHRGSRIERGLELVARPTYSPGATLRAYLDACVATREDERQREVDRRQMRLGDMGWGVIFADDDPMAAEIREALAPLLALRQSQAGARYKEFSYHGREHKGAFLARHGVAAGSPMPDRVPYYLLIVGSPDRIPFLFQYQLDIQYGVGRLHFATAEEYAHYAASVVAAETTAPRLPRKLSLFSPSHDGDEAMNASRKHLTDPLGEYVEREHPDWCVDRVIGPDATRERLARLLGGADRPAFLFTSSHGMALPIDHELHAAHTGALVCADWKGRQQMPGPLARAVYFAADDIDDSARLHGTVVFAFSCYSAGITEYTDYERGGKREKISPRDALTPLCQRLLGHPGGGALAIIGRIERAWSTSFVGGRGASALGHFTVALGRLLRGYPVGAAMDPFNQRYGELASELAELGDSDEATRNTSYMMNLRTTARDARNYVVLGDPAVRLMVVPHGR